MPIKYRSVLVISIFMITAVLLSSCTQSLSSAPVETPTLIPTGLFVSPVASMENPMEMIEQFAKQTEAAQTAAAGGGTPAAPADGTAQAATAVTNTPGIAAATATPTVTTAVATPTNANAAATPNTAATSVPPVIASGSEYYLREGEYPYCIARRYNVDPEALLQASGLTSPDIYYAGLRLVIPNNGPFPGPRSLKPHPASYTVASGNETVYSIACAFGDVDPNAIITTNGLSGGGSLTIGQVLQIP
jgi:LysM repeat protein